MRSVPSSVRVRVCSMRWAPTFDHSIKVTLLHQQPKGSDKIYALHELQADCISKGEARVRYEFCCKVSIAATPDEGFVVGMRSFSGNPYDGIRWPRRWDRWKS